MNLPPAQAPEGITCSGVVAARNGRSGILLESRKIGTANHAACVTKFGEQRRGLVDMHFLEE